MDYIQAIKSLRLQTGAGLHFCKKALEASAGDFEKAKANLHAQGMVRVQLRQDSETPEYHIELYRHGPDSGPCRIAVMIELRCQTDFLASTWDFRQLARRIAMQVAAESPTDVPTLLGQSWIQDETKTIADLIAETISASGENIRVGRFCRFGPES